MLKTENFLKDLGFEILSPNKSRKKKVSKSHVPGLKMEIYEFKAWWNSAHHQKNISEVFPFIIQYWWFFPFSCVWFSDHSFPFFMFLYGMLKLNIITHLLWKIDVFFYFHHNGTQVHTTQVVFYFPQSRWGFLVFLRNVMSC